MLKFLPKSLFLATVSLFTFVSSALAHGGENLSVEEAVVPTLEESIRSNSIKVVFIAAIIIIISVILTILFRDKGEGVKRVLFTLIVVPTVIATLFIAGSTLYLNFQSSSGGPVHWPAEYEIWDCGQEVNLIDPQGLSNKVGAATLHEHNDNWIHLEGVVTEDSEATLGNYFKVIGGNLSDDGFSIPTQDGVISRHGGDTCSDGFPATLQVFVYQTEGKVFTQKKLEDPENYILSPAGNIPPGDCIIFEFDPIVKDTTDKLCNQYELQIMKGNLSGN